MPHDHPHPHRHDHDHSHSHDHGHDHGTAPVLVEVTRGTGVESRHRGHALIVDARGKVLAHWGDFDSLVFPRSAIKPIQALPLVESGAADAFGLEEADLALACASHNGEPVHAERAAGVLAKIGCTVDDLECGSHAPGDGDSAAALIAAGAAPCPLHNNCSGKHVGFLAVARHKGEPTQGYVEFQHPVQQRWIGLLEQLSGQDLSAAPWGRDGCSIPTLALSLGGLAVAMARFADPDGLPEARVRAIHRIRRAWGAHPYLVAGRNRFDTAVMEATGGRVQVKAGAEGVSCACLPEMGLGIAVKIEDGAERAASVAMAALLDHAGAFDAEARARLAALLEVPLTNRRGFTVGAVRTAPGFPI